MKTNIVGTLAVVCFLVCVATLIAASVIVANNHSDELIHATIAAAGGIGVGFVLAWLTVLAVLALSD